jgi:hypothetical protein
VSKSTPLSGKATDTNNIIHLYPANRVLEKSVSLRKNEKGQGRRFLEQYGTAAIRRKVSQPRAEYTRLPLDDTLTATAEDFLLLELMSPVELEPEAEIVDKRLLETVICLEISEKGI